MNPVAIFTIVSMVLLAVSVAFSIRYATRREELRTGNAFLFNLLGFGALLGAFATISVRQGGLALNTLSDSVVVFALILLAVSNIAARLASSHAISILITPLVIGLELISLFFDRWFSTLESRRALNSTFLNFHILLFLLSYAFFAIGACFALLFLIMDRILKSKDYRPIFFKLPGLSKLDNYSSRSAMIGLGLLTLAIGLSFLTLLRQGATVAQLFTDFTILSTVALWLYYGLFLILRLSWGWVGRRACYYSLFGIAFVLAFYFAGKAAPSSSLHGFESRAVVSEAVR